MKFSISLQISKELLHIVDVVNEIEKEIDDFLDNLTKSSSSITISIISVEEEFKPFFTVRPIEFSKRNQLIEIEREIEKDILSNVKSTLYLKVFIFNEVLSSLNELLSDIRTVKEDTKLLLKLNQFISDRICQITTSQN